MASGQRWSHGGNYEYRGHRGAEVVSSVFKVVALIVLIGGIVASIVTAIELEGHSANRGVVVGVAIGGIVGSIVAAASIGFFAYVLDLLMDIDWNTRGTHRLMRGR